MSLDPAGDPLDDLMHPAHARIATTLVELCGIPPQLAPHIAFRVLRDLCQDPAAVAGVRAIAEYGAGSPQDNPPLDVLPRLMVRPGGNRGHKTGGRRG